jgi:hypothetical protein
MRDHGVEGLECRLVLILGHEGQAFFHELLCIGIRGFGPDMRDLVLERPRPAGRLCRLERDEEPRQARIVLPGMHRNGS